MSLSKSTYSILSEKIISGNYVLFNTGKKLGYAARFFLVKNSNKTFSEKKLIFLTKDKSEITQLLECNFDVANGFVLNSQKINKHEKISFIEFLIIFLLVLIETIVSLKTGFLHLETIDVIAKGIFFQVINFSLFAIYKIISLHRFYNINHRVRDTYNSLIELQPVAKVFMNVKDKLLKYSPFISSETSVLLVNYNIVAESFDSLKKNISSTLLNDEKILFSCDTVVNNVKYYVAVSTLQNRLCINIASNIAEDFSNNYVNLDVIKDHVSSGTIDDLMDFAI